ncbi:hypothetical protein MTP10_11350 [Nonomuraea sp. 3-1Str]|uniref:hypothetical protein n=1 Tax=Nonomuraea sp. 3-1Str TaxID=2929801 RepID=UPI002862C1A8|nr:hypothetical protein [Nonomuraea sp. 3-1Str]MDR8409334.1 hypothetical protein [Nonomuraea sp. 3-1Str]
MPGNRAHVVVHELIRSFSCPDAAALADLLARAAADVSGTGYAGLVRVDPLREAARVVHLHAPPGDPLGVRPWLAEPGVLKLLTLSAGQVRLPRDATVGEPGFLATPVPLAAREQLHLWVAGRDFGDHDEHLLSRLATAGGRALEAASGLEAAARLLRGVHAFGEGRPAPTR